MKKFFLFTSIFLFSSSAFASAVLLEFTGKPSFAQDGKTLLAQSGSMLADGVQISTDQKSSAQLMLESGAIIKVAAKQNYRVGDVAAKAQQTGFIKGVQIALNEVKAGGQSPTVHGMVKMGQPATGMKNRRVVSSGLYGVTGLYPVHTTIRQPEMPFTLRWSPESKMPWANPVVVVENAKKESIFMEKIDAKEGMLKTCPCKMGLKAGEKYSWYFAQQTPERVLLKGSRFSFNILSAADEKALQSDLKLVAALPLQTDFAKALLNAQLYFKYNLLFDMVQTLTPLYQPTENKTDEKNLVRDLLFLGNARMGLAKEAEKYR